MKRMLGRKPRTFQPHIPHMSAVMAGALNLPPLPLEVDNSLACKAPFGAMLNSELGCCTIAAFYHGRQIWSQLGQDRQVTATDTQVLQLYEEACGYNPKDPSTDQGGVEQDVLTYLLQTGAPVGQGRDKLMAFFEVDPRQRGDVQRAIFETGCCYIGIDLPSNIMPDGGDPPTTWDTDPTSHSLGGHAVILVGYTTAGPLLISWGVKYQATWAFFEKYCAEAYALVDHAFFQAKGTTFLGMSPAQLGQQMQATLHHKRS